MKRFHAVFLLSISLILIMNSCVSRKKLTYLRYSDQHAQYDMNQNDNIVSVTPSTYKIMPFDNLFIRVLTPDPQWSALFNADVGQGGLTQESAALFGYPVDLGGNIEIPYVGRIRVIGKNLSEIKEELDSTFKHYVTDASITVKLVNNYVTVIGEVRAPGRYSLTKDCLTIFEALSLAGDLGEYSNRQRIQLIRPSPYGPIIKEFSLSDRSILSSEYYYIMPNDVLYAAPLHGKSFQINASVWSLFLTTITSALGIIAFFRTL